MKATVGLVLLAVLMLVGLLAALASASATGDVGDCAVDASAGGLGLSAEQVGNARTIARVGSAAAVPPPGLVVAIATALQESSLRNLPYGDRDSLGLFQQRPSQGWGTPAQILDPVHAASRFYAALRAVPGWQLLPVAVAAQAVQHSGHPNAYARWADDAARIVTELTGVTPAATTNVDPSCGGALPEASSAVVGRVIGFAAGQVGDAYVLGANGPDAWDCSSLVRAAYAQAGVELPRTAAEQYDLLRRRHTLAVNRPTLAVLRPGDLLFSTGAEPHNATDGTPIGHVALYAGAGVVIEAKGWASGVVRQSYSNAALGLVTAVGRLVTTTPATPSERPATTTREAAKALPGSMPLERSPR